MMKFFFHKCLKFVINIAIQVSCEQLSSYFKDKYDYDPEDLCLDPSWRDRCCGMCYGEIAPNTLNRIRLPPGLRQFRIHKGEVTNTGIYKFMAHLEERQLGVIWSGICGAVITENRYVVTAVHCVKRKRSSNLSIVVNKGMSNEARASVESITMRVSRRLTNDVAVLRLAANAVIVSGHHIPLAKPEDGDRSGKTCIIMVWGLTASGSASSVLLKTDGKILSSSECAAYWNDKYNHNVHICIDNKNSGACNGDSGGPMICNDQLAGVTSWGMRGCNITFPSVYTRISSFNDWYTSKTSPLPSKQIPVPVLY